MIKILENSQKIEKKSGENPQIFEKYDVLVGILISQFLIFRAKYWGLNFTFREIWKPRNIDHCTRKT